MVLEKENPLPPRFSAGNHVNSVTEIDIGAHLDLERVAAMRSLAMNDSALHPLSTLSLLPVFLQLGRWPKFPQ